MARYVALLRGINVGGNKKIKMADLREVFESRGFQNVKTLLASGNVLFEASEADAATLSRRIEDQIEVSFGFSVGVILRAIEQIQQIADSQPFQGISVTPNTRLYVSFLAEKPSHSLKIPYESPGKDFRILRVSGGEVFSVLTLNAGSRSVDAMSILEKEFGRKITTRNWNTVTRILESK